LTWIHKKITRRKQATYSYNQKLTEIKNNPEETMPTKDF